MRLDTFNAVETHYNNTKPVVSKYHTKEDDIRPLGRRTRKHERIEKRSDTEYVFHYQWSPLGKTAHEKRPPITWQKLIRKGEETEVVTVRGATADHDTTRHNFLRSYLPWGLLWCVRSNGRHSVAVVSSIDDFAKGQPIDNSHYMPHPKTAYNRHVKMQKFVETDYRLRFTRTGGVGAAWQCTTPEWPITRSHVNKARKAALREHNDKFWEWMCSVGSMLHTNWDHLQNLEQEVKEYVKEEEIRKAPTLEAINDIMSRGPRLTSPMSYNFWPRFPQTLALEVVKDYNHPLRIHLATSFLAQNDIKSLTSKEDNSRFRSAYNQWFNKQLGIMEEVIK